jgi:hypothetical protein
VGPRRNYAAIPFLGKWVLILCMLLGRLEIYTVIVLLMPEYWKKLTEKEIPYRGATHRRSSQLLVNNSHPPGLDAHTRP